MLGTLFVFTFFGRDIPWHTCRVVLSEAVDRCICFIRKIQHGGDWERSRPQGPKNVHNFLMTVRPLSWVCGHGTEMLLILKIHIFDLITPRYFPIWEFKEMSHDFVRGQFPLGLMTHETLIQVKVMLCQREMQILCLPGLYYWIYCYILADYPSGPANVFFAITGYV